MKRLMKFPLSILAAATFLVVPAAFGQSASGSFKVVAAEGTSTFEFDAARDARGNTAGSIKFSGPITIPNQDVDLDGTGDPRQKGTIVSLGIAVDCLQVVGSRAVLGGKISDSTVREYTGRRVLFTVEQGDVISYAFGQYRSTVPTWVASDAELKEDPGVGMRWWATDAEQKDDRGIQMGNPPTDVDCQTYTIASHDLDALPKDAGTIAIKQ